jgi:hypothetical protein
LNRSYFKKIGKNGIADPKNFFWLKLGKGLPT